jgi:hypothetical protein
MLIGSNLKKLDCGSFYNLSLFYPISKFGVTLNIVNTFKIILFFFKLGVGFISENRLLEHHAVL